MRSSLPDTALLAHPRLVVEVKKKNLRFPQKRQRLTRDRAFPDLRIGILSFSGSSGPSWFLLYLGYLLGTVVVHDVDSMFRGIKYLIFRNGFLGRNLSVSSWGLQNKQKSQRATHDGTVRSTILVLLILFRRRLWAKMDFVLETTGRPGSHAKKFINYLLRDADNPPIAVRDTWSTIQSVLHSAISKSPNSNLWLPLRDSWSLLSHPAASYILFLCLRVPATRFCTQPFSVSSTLQWCHVALLRLHLF